MDLRGEPSWVTPTTHDVLAVLEEATFALPTGTIRTVLERHEDGRSHNAILRAMDRLEAHDLVRTVDAPSRDHYELTERGEAFLAGELVPDE